MRTLRFWRWLYQQRYWWFQRQHLFQMPSVIYEGLPGSGKSLAMVRDCIQYMRLGYRVASNLEIRDPYTGQVALQAMTWLSVLRHIRDARRDNVPIVVAIDELQELCDARDWALTPAPIRTMFTQKRKYKMGLIGSTQALANVEKRLRSVIAYMVRYERVIPERPSLAWSVLPAVLVWVGAGVAAWYYGRFQAPLAFALYGLVALFVGGSIGVFVGLASHWLVDLFSRQAWFRETSLDPTGVDVPGSDWELKDTRVVWMPWYAFHGYSTWNTIPKDDLKAYTEESMVEELNAIMEEINGYNERDGIPAFADVEASVSLWSGAEVLEPVGIAQEPALGGCPSGGVETVEREMASMGGEL